METADTTLGERHSEVIEQLDLDAFVKKALKDRYRAWDTVEIVDPIEYQVLYEPNLLVAEVNAYLESGDQVERKIIYVQESAFNADEFPDPQAPGVVEVNGRILMVREHETLYTDRW